MIKTGTTAIAILLLLACLPAQANITVSVPDVPVPYGAVSHTFVVTAEFDGSYDIGSYAIDLLLDARDGATGVTFSGAGEAATDYILPNNVGFLEDVTDFEVFGDDAVNSDPETIADATKNLIEVTLDLNLTGANVGDQYDVTFDTDWSDVFDASGGQLAVTWNPGVITVVPEPSTTVLALIGLVAVVPLFRRRR